MPARLRRPRYADVVGTLALVVAVGASGAYAAGAHLPKNSVTSKQVKNGTLKAVDFKAGELPAGVKGDKGAKGDPGAPGPNLLATGTAAVVSQPMGNSCQAAFITSSPFTVSSKAVVYASATLDYSSTLANDSATASISVIPGA